MQGPHLMLDCYSCPREKLEDTQFITQILSALPIKFGMTEANYAPAVFTYEGKNAGEWGISGVVRTPTSHISIHTFPDQNHVFIDVFAYNNFNAAKAREEFVRLFAAADFEEVIVGGEDAYEGEFLCHPLVS